MSGWLPALRLARRAVRRALGRSVLVVALVAIPVAGLTVGDGIIGSTTGPDVDRYRAFGAADATVQVTPYATVDYPHTGGGVGDREQAVDLGELLPAGTRATRDMARYCTACLRFTSDGRPVAAGLDLVAVGDPLTHHLVRLASGRLPDKPDEALVTTALDERVGETFTVVGGRKITVTGVAVQPSCVDCAAVVAAPGSPIEDDLLASAHSPRARPGYLLDLPAGTDLDTLGRTLAASGVVLANPANHYVAPVSTAPLVLTGGLGLLLVVVLAGAAFAVGARRQVRELGLVAVNGGTARQLRVVVVAQGLVLGVVGAVTGVAAGLLAAIFGTPLWERITGQLIESWRFPSVAVIAAAGVLACVVAAVAPAVAVARLPPADALAGRPRHPAARSRFVVPGAVLLAGGLFLLTVIGVAGSTPWRDSTAPAAGVLLGVLAVVVGLVFVAPPALVAAGRVSGRLPLAGRLAVRDAARHRPRTVAGVLAVTVTVAASVVLGFWFATMVTRAQPPIPQGSVLLQVDPAAKDVRLDDTVRRFTSALPGSTSSVVGLVDSVESGTVYLTPPDSRAPCGTGDAVLGIATPELLAAIAGRPDAGIRSALDDGKIVVFDRCLVDDAGVTRTMAPEEVLVPGHLAAAPYYSQLPSAFIAEEAAAARGWTSHADTALVTLPAGTEDAALEAAVVDAVGAGMLGTTALPPPDHSDLALLVATVVAMAGVAVTLALTAAEGRADLATLAVLGAQPWRRRTLAGAQALVIGGAGTVLGVLLGGFAGIASIRALLWVEPAVPWGQLAVTVVAVPLLAVAVAVLGTRARLPEGVTPVA